jgi:glycosyltransferase involved in cell wall biosynthesis
MKIAIVHDELVRRGGAEQVTLLLHKAFPKAPIYTSCYSPQNTYDDYKNCDVRTTWLSPFVKNEKMLKRLFFPFCIWAMRRIDLKDYDIVIISTTTCAKFVKTSHNSLYVAFCHFPFRLAWFPQSYNHVLTSKGIRKILYKTVVSILKRIDYKAAQKINWFITNTPAIKEEIRRCYNPVNDICVIPASIVCKNFYVSEKPHEDYYLVVSRFEPYKKVQIVIEAFNRMPDKKLIIVGKGSQKENYRKLANSNIEFKEGVPMGKLADLYANCKAFIFPQEEDYGLTPIEANASGRPVIAYGKGGVTFTTIPYGSSKKATSIFFDEQTPEKVIEAIKKAESIEFDPQYIRKHAEIFDEDIFIENIRNYVLEKYNAQKNGAF